MSTVKLKDIRRDGGTQPRAGLYEDWAQEYAEEMRAGATFPPVVVFYDGSEYWLADGFHRCRGYEIAGHEDVNTDIRQGTRRDAVLYSVGANGSHGHRRTNSDKRQAVMTLLNDTEWSKWSDNAISKQCGVSQPFVSSLRKSDTYNNYKSEEPRTYTTRHGTQATMNTGNIGQRPDNARKDQVDSDTAPAFNIPAPQPMPDAPRMPSTPELTEDQKARLDKAKAGEAVVANISTDGALLWHAERDGIYVRADRKTTWGNPFLLHEDGDRDAVCDSYALHYVPNKPSIKDNISSLKGKVLGCWCYPQRCHCDHLAELANDY